MIKENESEFNDLITYRKVGYGKVSIVDYNFIIDKDYNARVELCLSSESSIVEKTIGQVKLDDDEIKLVDDFINNIACKKKEELPLVNDEISKYEREEIYYDNVIIEDDNETNKVFKSLAELIQESHEEISSENVSKAYNEMSSNFYIGKSFK